MNVETGEIKEFTSNKLLQQAVHSDKWVELTGRPNPGCSRCHGRGHIGFHIAKNEYIVCRCVKKRPTNGDRK